MRSTILFLILILFFSIISLFVGVVDISPYELINGDINQLEIFILSRLPRLCATLLAGAGLAIAGLIMQQLCQNSFVSPTTAGTISYAQFGILLALIFFPNSTIFSRAIFAFVTAMIGTWIYVAFIQAIQFKDAVMVALIGIMFGYVVGGITNYFAFKYEMVQALQTWLTGSFSLVIKGRYEMLYIVPVLIIVSMFFANHFNIVGMGKDFSKNLGIPYNAILFLGLTLSALLTASVVVVVGTISYIGLIIPNLIRMFKGDNLKGTIIDTALFGALFVLVCDIIGRAIVAPYELPIELIAGMLGGIIFIALIVVKLNGRVGKLNFMNFFMGGGCSCKTKVKDEL
ncbi:MAG: iron chelate uptake ABC transporter family permease subunit [Campylobacter sp.]|nr:iron chelate uptake ABC transporter family permease subunit [Campylobacter sp.]